MKRDVWYEDTRELSFKILKILQELHINNQASANCKIIYIILRVIHATFRYHLIALVR